MTFIVAIQLEDSIIITADHRTTSLKNDGTYKFYDENKFYFWNKGVIAGSGEATVIDNAVEFFIKLSNSNTSEFPKCLKISRMIRELEYNHFQIKTTKIFYSNYSENGAQLYSIDPDDKDDYTVKVFEKNNIMVSMFYPDITSIKYNLMDLYSNLKPYTYFDNTIDWVNYYLKYLCEIYKKQCKKDQMMSESFDIFCQTKDEYFHAYIENKKFKTVNKLIFY